MIKYKVKVLRVQGMNNKTYTPDTITTYGKGIVTDQMFPEGNAEKLAKNGYLEPLKLSAADIKAQKEKEKNTETAKEIVKKAAEKLETAKANLSDMPEDAEEAVKSKLTKELEDAQLALKIANEELNKLK